MEGRGEVFLADVVLPKVGECMKFVGLLLVEDASTKACSPIFTFSRPWGIGGWRWKSKNRLEAVVTATATGI
jgi:hypothetical protein